MKSQKQNRRKFLGLFATGAGVTALSGLTTNQAFGQPNLEGSKISASYHAFYDEVFSLPVWDTHNHLHTSAYLCARSFWDMAHDSWFASELRAAGYPGFKEISAMSNAQKAKAFITAFRQTRNTMWHRSFKQTMNDLWDVELTDEKSVLEADARIAQTGTSNQWASIVCKKAALEKITLVGHSDNGLQDIKNLLYKMLGGFNFERQMRAFSDSTDQKASILESAQLIEPYIAEQSKNGVHVFRVSLPESVELPELKKTENPRGALRAYLGIYLLEALNKHKAHLQIFTGVERGPRDAGAPGGETQINLSHPLNDPARIPDMHQFFRKYKDCTFEIVNAAQLSNLDIVQAAGVYGNVVPGGIWWFNFRTSVFNEVFQYRMEALPPSRCTLVATDARSIEWAYCKIITIKNVLAKFLWKQIKEGNLDRETAIYIAKEWLYGAAARYYR